MEKTPLELAQTAFDKWLHVIDGVLEDSELSFHEFTGCGLRHDLQGAGEALARAEAAVLQARSLIRGGFQPKEKE